jgi:DNA-binding LacI/PurR family transcriptional regulator
MKDIALRCGVSIATVSKALNGQQDISENTRERVCQVANEMGYLTNASARALKTNRTYNIGVLFVDEQHSGLAHEYFSSVLDSVKVEAERNGYDITFINRNIGRRSSTYLQHALYRGVDGVIIACVDFEDPQVIELVNSQLPIVTIDHVFNNRLAVISDNVAGMEALVRHAYSMGHRRIAFIHGEMTSVTKNRITGFYRACEKLGLTVPEEYIRSSYFHDSTSCAEITQELLALPEPPTCIIFPDDFSYIGGMNAIKSKGLRIPEDISVMGYDGISLGDMISPRLTTYQQNTLELGRAAARGLIDLIERPRTTLVDRMIVSGRIVVRDTVKDLNLEKQ